MINLLNVMRCAIDNHTMRLVKKSSIHNICYEIVLHHNKCFGIVFILEKKRVNHIECAICVRLEHLSISICVESISNLNDLQTGVV